MKGLRLLIPFYVLYCFGVLIWAYFVDPVHDYSAYLKHWELILSGGDPWQKMPAANAYGPVYNIFAFIYWLEPQLPKLIFVSSWLAVTVFVTIQFRRYSSATDVEKNIFSVFWLLNPFFIVSTVYYGFNDSFVALLVFLALYIILYTKSKKIGVSIISLAVLTKIYPVFLLPFTSAKKSEIYRLFIIFTLVIFIVYLITYLLWGTSFLNAFGKANGRDPTLFSIMRFLNGELFPFEMVGSFFLQISVLLILFGLWFVFRLFKNGRIEQHTAFLAGLTVLLLFYKAGQFQFFLTYFAVFAVWTLVEFKKESPNRLAFYSILFLGLWFEVMVGIIYPVFNWYNGEYIFIREWIGLPTFIMEVFILYFLLKRPSSKTEVID